MPPRLVLVGEIVAAHGVRGEVKVRSFTQDPAAIASYGPLITEDGTAKYRVRLKAIVRDAFVARLAGVETREAAEALKGTRLYVARTRLPKPEPDEFYHADLVGLAALTPEGAPLGQVHALHEFGAAPVIELRDAAGAATMLPFTLAHVPEVDVAAGRIVVVLPDEAPAAADSERADA